MISVAEARRADRGLRFTSIRPELSVVLEPSTPMNDARLSTSGSFRIASARAVCRRAIAPYEVDCGASVITWIRPVSCTGKKPLEIPA